MKKEEDKDIGMLSEVIELLKNLTSMESHAQSSYRATKDKRFLQAKDAYREIRKKWLDVITKKNFGESWCINKHSCESMMRLDEVQARFLSMKQEKDAELCSEHYQTILYWMVELNDLMDLNGEIKSEA